jgi:hypothetical protein
VTGRRGRRRQQTPVDLKETRGYLKLKDEALGPTLWRTRCGRGYGPVVRQAMHVKVQTLLITDAVSHFLNCSTIFISPVVKSKLRSPVPE